MPVEIERKFLVINDDWRSDVSSSRQYIQGYLASNKECSIRVRISGNEANLNIKSATLGITRSEFDYAIPPDDARDLLQNLCGKPLLEKTRYYVRHHDHLWEIDEFGGDNAGLIVAELELASTGETFDKPGWCGREVSDDPRYYNVCLVQNPYKNW